MSNAASSLSARMPSAVTVLVARRVRPGHAQAFEAASEGMTAAARNFRGHLGGYIVKPCDEPAIDANLHPTVFAFDTEEKLAAWQQSPERGRWVEAMAPHTEADTGTGRTMARDVEMLPR